MKDRITIKKNSAQNCEAYNSFEGVSSDHRILTAKFQLSLRTNKKSNNPKSGYDWKKFRENLEI